MACFVVPAAEAVITTVATKVMESKGTSEVSADSVSAIPFSRKLKWLRNLLWGGSGLLVFEHVWHGEIVPFAPFLTAAASRAEALEMLREMATVGTAMSGIVTAVWLGMVGVASAVEKRARRELGPQG